MSNFIIGNKPIKSISGPIRVCVLKPDEHLKRRFEEEGGRLPYIVMFGDRHFDKEGNCENCDCQTIWKTGEGWSKGDCCYEIDNPDFLKLFDGLASKNFPIDFYIEQMYEPRLADPDIYKINETLKGRDSKGYLAKFIHDYKICYSKEQRRTKSYKKDCPTRDLRWHYIDTRIVEYGNIGEAELYKGITLLWTYLYKYFNKNKPENEENSFKEGKTLISKHVKEIQMVFDIIVNGPNFINNYITEDSNFLLAKQVKKQVIPELKNIELWKTIMIERIHDTFYDYYIQDSTYTVNDYIICMDFYKLVMVLISNEKITKEEFLEERKNLMDKVKTYDLFGETLENLYNMYTLTTATSMMDMYTVTRMLKKPKDGVPGFCSMFYAGDLHIKSVKDILTKYFSYTVIGESINENVRCQNVSNINFNLFKVKQEYK